MCENNRFKKLSGITSRLSSVYNLNDTLLEDILKDVLALIGTDIGCFYVLNRKEKLLEIKSVAGFEKESIEKTRNLGEGLTGQAALDGKSKLVHKEKNILHLSGNRSKIYSEIVVPFKYENEVTGVLVTKSADPDILFKQDDLELMEVFAEHMASAVERDKRDKLTLYHHEISRMSLNRNLQELFDYVVEAVHDLTGLAVILWQVTPDGDALQVKAHHGIQSDYIKRNSGISMADSITGVALKENRLIWRRDIQDDQEFPKFYNLSEAQKQNWRFFISVPLTGDQNTPLGSLSLYGQQPDIFNESLKALLAAFANQVASAIDNNRIYWNVINKLNEVTTAVLSESEPEKVFDKILEAMTSLMRNASLCEIRIFNKQDESLECKRTSDISVSEKYQKRKKGEGIIGWVAEHRESVYVPDVSKNKHYIKFMETTKSEIAVPMLKGQELVGVLNIEHPDLKAFTENDVKLAEVIANLAALSVRNAEDRKKQIISLKEISRSINFLKSYDDIMRNILGAIISFMGEDVFCEIKTLDVQKKELKATYRRGRGYDDETKKIEGLPVEKGITGWVFRNRETYYSNDVTKDEKYYEFLDDTQSEIAVPIFREDDVIGVLNIEHPEKNAFNEDDKKIAEALANFAAIALENKRTMVLFSKLQEITQNIASESFQGDDILKLVVESLHSIFDDAACLISRYDSDTDTFEKAAVVGMGGGDIITPRSGGTSRYILETRKPRYIKDTSVEPSDGGPQVNDQIIKDGVKAVANIPLIHKDQFIGALYLNLYRIYTFSEVGKQILEFFAGQAAIAIHNSDLYERVQNQKNDLVQALGNINALYEKIQSQKNAILQALKAISASISSQDNQDEMLDKIISTTRWLMGRESSCGIRLFNPVTDTLKVVCHHGKKLERGLTEIKIGQGIMGWVAENKKPIYVPDVNNDSRYIRFLAGTRSEIAAPMLAGEELIGVLNIEHPKVNAFTDDDIKLAEAIANLAAVAIKNSRNEHALANKIKEQNISLEISKILSSEGLDS